MLHAHLYVKRHKHFNDCFLDAMEFEDNMNISSVSGQEDEPSSRQGLTRERASNATTTIELNLEKIAGVVQRME